VSSPSLHISLVAPQLKLAESAPVYARTLPTAYSDINQCLWQLFNHPSTQRPALAAISYQTDGPQNPDTNTDRIVIRADPIHLRLDRQAAFLIDADFLAIQDQEAQVIINTLNEFYADDDFDFIAPHPQRWYIRLSQPIDLANPSVAQLRGENMAGFKSTGKDAKYWQQRQVEIQMLLHDHPVNQQREQQGQALINSLWLWGEGELASKPTTPWQQVYTDNSLVKSLAQHAQIDCQTCPSNAQALLALADTHTSILCVLSHDFQQIDPKTAYQQWQQDWLAPLQQAITTRQVASVKLYSGEQPAYQLNRPPWWQRGFKR